MSDISNSRFASDLINLETINRLKKSVINQPKTLGDLRQMRLNHLNSAYPNLQNPFKSPSFQNHAKQVAGFTLLLKAALDLRIIKTWVISVCNWSTFCFSILITILNIYIFNFRSFFSFKYIYLLEKGSSLPANLSSLPLINQILERLQFLTLNYNLSANQFYSLFFQFLYTWAGLSVFVILNSLLLPFLHKAILSNKTQTPLRIILSFGLSGILSLLYLFNPLSWQLFLSSNLNALISYLVLPLSLALLKIFLDYLLQFLGQINISNRFQNLKPLLAITSFSLLLLATNYFDQNLALGLGIIASFYLIILGIQKLYFGNLNNLSNFKTIYVQSFKFNLQKFFSFLKILTCAIIFSLPILILHLIQKPRFVLNNYYRPEFNFNFFEISHANYVTIVFSAMILALLGVIICQQPYIRSSRLYNLHRALALCFVALLCTGTLLNINAYSSLNNQVNYFQRPAILNKLNQYCSPKSSLALLPNTDQLTTFFSPQVPINKEYLSSSCNLIILDQNNATKQTKLIENYIVDIKTQNPDDGPDITIKLLSNLQNLNKSTYFLVEDNNNPTLKTFNATLKTFHPPILSQESMYVYNF